MSKVLLVIVFVAMLCGGFVPQVSSDTGYAGSPLEFLARACVTPEQVARFLHDNVVFQDDLSQFGQDDYWQTPAELLVHRHGDCEDYALLAQDLLSRQGIEAFIFSLYGERGYAHTVCIFVEGGRYNVMNQDCLMRFQAGSLQELADRLYPRWSWGAIAERWGHRGRAIRVIRKENGLLIHAGFGDKIRIHLPDVKVANPANHCEEGGIR